MWEKHSRARLDQTNSNFFQSSESNIKHNKTNNDNNNLPFRRLFYSKRTFEMGAGKEEQPQVVFIVKIMFFKIKTRGTCS